jgi:hypothetical protein
VDFPVPIKALLALPVAVPFFLGAFFLLGYWIGRRGAKARALDPATGAAAVAAALAPLDLILLRVTVLRRSGLFAYHVKCRICEARWRYHEEANGDGALLCPRCGATATLGRLRRDLYLRLRASLEEPKEHVEIKAP